MGIGVVVRDSDGRFVASAAHSMKGRFSPKILELYAILLEECLPQKMGFYQVILLKGFIEDCVSKQALY